jgi:hypothetical protein
MSSALAIADDPVGRVGAFRRPGAISSLLKNPFACGDSP